MGAYLCLSMQNYSHYVKQFVFRVPCDLFPESDRHTVPSMPSWVKGGNMVATPVTQSGLNTFDTVAFKNISASFDSPAIVSAFPDFEANFPFSPNTEASFSNGIFPDFLSDGLLPTGSQPQDGDTIISESGFFTGSLEGIFTGSFNGTLETDITTLSGSFTGSFEGEFEGNFSGSFTGSILLDPETLLISTLEEMVVATNDNFQTLVDSGSSSAEVRELEFDPPPSFPGPMLPLYETVKSTFEEVPISYEMALLLEAAEWSVSARFLEKHPSLKPYFIELITIWKYKVAEIPLVDPNALSQKGRGISIHRDAEITLNALGDEGWLIVETLPQDFVQHRANIPPAQNGKIKILFKKFDKKRRLVPRIKYKLIISDIFNIDKLEEKLATAGEQGFELKTNNSAIYTNGAQVYILGKILDDKEETVSKETCRVPQTVVIKSLPINFVLSSSMAGLRGQLSGDISFEFTSSLAATGSSFTPTTASIDFEFTSSMSVTGSSV